MGRNSLILNIGIPAILIILIGVSLKVHHDTSHPSENKALLSDANATSEDISARSDVTMSPRPTHGVSMVTPTVTPWHNVTSEVSPVTPSVSPSATSTQSAIEYIQQIPQQSYEPKTYEPTPYPSMSLSPSTLVSVSPLPSIEAHAVSLSVIINEIGWMGTQASAADEWLELYNTTDRTVSLGGWVLAADDGSPSVVLQGAIPPHGYYLVERTDDQTISDISADMVASFGKGGLNNVGERIILKDTTGYMRDSVDCTIGWYAGDNAQKASMERRDPFRPGTRDNWGTNTGLRKNGHDASGGIILGTPKSVNSLGLEP